MLRFCNKCGRIVQEIYGKETQICDCCNNILKYIPEEFLMGKTKCIFNDERKDEFIQKYIKSSPEFDQYLFNHRDEILAKQLSEFNSKMKAGKAILEKQSQVPKCPTCQSTNIRKISGLERGASIYAFGLFSKKINKTFKCNNCNYTW
jgi:hypothetical protein